MHMLMAGLLLLPAAGAGAAEPPLQTAAPGTYKAALVALVDDAALRASFEDTLAAKGVQHGFQAVPSHTLVPRLSDFKSRKVPAALRKQGINVLVMMRPAAVGPGSSLESVRDSLPAGLYDNMRDFAGRASGADADDLIAVVHVAIYSAATSQPKLVTAGAVWLSEPVESRQQGIDRLQDMLIANVESAREQIRQQLDAAATP